MEVVNESQDVINQREWETSWNWSASGFYSSKVDSRLWVPKRPVTGSGQAINLGHPGARLFVAGILIAPLVVIAAIVLATAYAD
jgi:uncharacterized membrane protein